MARARAAAAAEGAADADGTSAPAAAVRGIRGAPGTWRRVRRAAQEASAHALLLCFTTLLSLKLDGVFSRSWWMCGALMPGYGETITDEDIWESLPHFWVAISMVFLLAATSLMLLKLCGDAGTLGWWDLFINFGIALCFAYLVCIRWSNPMDIGGPVLIIPNVIFQVLLCMRLEAHYLVY